VKFGTLEIRNFLTIGHANLSLADRGLVLIQGVNEDDSSAESNGAGKSSIVDALCWALFGVTARGEDGDKVVNRTVGKDCQVGINVHDDDGNTYAIVRHRKHKTGKNGVTLHVMVGHGGPVNDLTQGTDKLTQEKIDQVLGCSYDVFCAAVYAGQDKMPDLPGMTDKNLKMLVEEAAGVTILEAAYEQARKELTGIKNEVELAKGTIAGAENNLLAAIGRVESMRSSGVEWEDKRANELLMLKARMADHSRTVRELSDRFTAFDVPKIEADLAVVVTKLAAVEGERDTEKRLIGEVSSAERAVTAFKTNLAHLKARYAREKADFEAVDGKIGTPCGECGKDYCEHDLAAAKALAGKKASATATEYKTIKTQAEDALQALQSAQDALSSHRASMTDISETTALSDALNAKLREADRAKQAVSAEMRLLKQVGDRHNELGAENNPFEAEIDRATEGVTTWRVRLGDLKAALTALEDKLQVAELVAKVFSPAGVRAHILDDVTPFLNEQTAKYLGTLSDGNITATWTTLVKNAKGELKEKFSIEVNHAEGGETFNSISGGEKRKVRIATALALQDLVARRATKPIDLFIGDEIDNALDDAGLERLTAILDEKAKERGTVLVISHSDLKDWISNVVTVTKRGKVSTVEEASV
jgi:DNA repair exonuclease SbcCD ATPase subunit